jgi:diadenosine tetraphosphate (Ap4A) HIT family hydrolase
MDKLLSRPEYDKFMQDLPDGKCTFCEWETYQIVLKEFDQWLWIANIAPYWKYHTMIMPKRHFEKYSDMTFMEAGELVKVIDYGEKKILDAKLLRDDGSLIEKVVYFWRHRFNRYDPISGTIRPSHFHLHLSPDKDRLWDSILDQSANSWDVNILKG